MDVSPSPIDESAGELMICPCCHHHNNPRVNFCTACRAPIGATAALGAYEHILAEGFILREAANGHSKSIVVAGIWILFLPVFLTACFLLIGGLQYFEPSLDHVVGLLAVIFCAVASAALIYRTTVNHRKKLRQKVAPDPIPPVG